MAVYRSRPAFKRIRRRGAVALEFSLVTGAFLLAVLGTMELGRAIMVYQVLTNTTREAARRAVVPGATDANLTASENDSSPANGIIAKYLKAAHIPRTHTAKIYVNDVEASLATARSHDPIMVEVSIPFSDVFWGPLRFMPGGSVLRTRVTMRKE